MEESWTEGEGMGVRCGEVGWKGGKGGWMGMVNGHLGGSGWQRFRMGQQFDGRGQRRGGGRQCFRGTHYGVVCYRREITWVSDMGDTSSLTGSSDQATGRTLAVVSSLVPSSVRAGG